MSANLLTRKEEVLFFGEEEAYEYIDKESDNFIVHSASVKYKKPTKKTAEGWIVSIQYFYKDPKELLRVEAEEG